MWEQVFLLLPELARLVSVRLLLRRLLIPFLETGSSMTPHLCDVYVFLFFCFLLGPCILAGHFVFTDIGYCTCMAFETYRQHLWFVFTDIVFTDMYGCVSGYVYGCVSGCVWVCVYGCV